MERKMPEKHSGLELLFPEYVRIADRFFQRVYSPVAKGYVYIPRDKRELKADGIAVDNPDVVKRFHGFTNELSHHNYRFDVNGFFNLYEYIEREAIAGGYPTIMRFLEHIFGNQIGLALDYFTLLWRMPTQLLPILVLVSKEQGTGKTSFLHFAELLFGANAIILNVSQYVQQFNGIYASKLVICIDETAVKEDFIKERLKQDSTASEINLRRMHMEFQKIPFFGKFILATNKEDSFARLENEDGRFWVRKVPVLEEFDPDFFEKLTAEIPAFIYDLDRREITAPNSSRQWFSPEQIRTDAFDVVVENSKSECAQDLKLWIQETINEKGAFGATITELWEALGRRHGRNAITRALRDELG